VKPQILTLVKKKGKVHASTTHVDEYVIHAQLSGALSLNEKQIDSF